MIYRKPTFDDVETIYQMVYDYAQEGAMLARSRNALYETLRDMVVAEEDGRVVGEAIIKIIFYNIIDRISIYNQKLDEKCINGKRDKTVN